MSKEKSLAAYKGKKLNCAQSVLSGFKESHGVDDARILEARAHGGGKAPGGRCGALHGALELLGDKCRADAGEAFLAAAGSLECREIRALKKLWCEDCVALAAEIVELMSRKNSGEGGRE